MSVITHRFETYQYRKPRKYVRKITGRRREVLHWMARGKDNVEIGMILGVSTLTVKNHVRDILCIYGAANRVCAVMRAMARGDVAADAVMREFA